MRHSEWFNRASERKTKRIEVIKNGIKTFEWVDAEEPTPEKTIVEDEAEDLSIVADSNALKPKKNNGNFHKAHCDKCAKETWHYIDRSALNPKAHCCDCPPSEAERKRMDRVKDATVVLAQLTPIHEQPTEGEIAVANRLDRSLWGNAEDRIAREYVDQEFAQRHIPPAEKVNNPLQTVCSFCGAPTDKILSTSERKTMIQKKIKVYKDADGNIQQQEQVIAKLETVHACSNCVVNIRKPVVIRRV